MYMYVSLDHYALVSYDAMLKLCELKLCSELISELKLCRRIYLHPP